MITDEEIDELIEDAYVKIGKIQHYCRGLCFNCRFGEYNRELEEYTCGISDLIGTNVPKEKIHDNR